MTFVKVYDKHTVVIPKKIREALGIKPGDIIEMKQEAHRIVLLPIKKSEKAVEETHGIIRWEKTIEEGIEAGYKRLGKESV
ncbi:MAG: AbrB/MazE/SpoVT family DNA-binding domain-containing protein [Candidatus Hydrothermarchaeales archaeon]